MASFHIRTNESGRKQGPFSAKQLKLLVKNGQLKPHHEISRDNGEWFRAETVKGLTLTESPQPPPFVEDSPGGDSEWDDLVEMESDQDVYQPQIQPAQKRSSSPVRQSSAFSPQQSRGTPAGAYPDGATTILVLGILGFVCVPILGIVASFLGHSYMKRCREHDVSPETAAVVGYILGRITTFFIILGVAIVVALVVMGIAFN